MRYGQRPAKDKAGTSKKQNLRRKEREERARLRRTFQTGSEPDSSNDEKANTGVINWSAMYNQNDCMAHAYEQFAIMRQMKGQVLGKAMFQAAPTLRPVVYEVLCLKSSVFSMDMHNKYACAALKSPHSIKGDIIPPKLLDPLGCIKRSKINSVQYLRQIAVCRILHSLQHSLPAMHCHISDTVCLRCAEEIEQ